MRSWESEPSQHKSYRVERFRKHQNRDSDLKDVSLGLNQSLPGSDSLNLHLSVAGKAGILPTSHAKSNLAAFSPLAYVFSLCSFLATGAKSLPPWVRMRIRDKGIRQAGKARRVLGHSWWSCMVMLNDIIGLEFQCWNFMNMLRKQLQIKPSSSFASGLMKWVRMWCLIAPLRATFHRSTEKTP